MKRGGLVLGVLLLAAVALGLWYFLLRGPESPAPVPQAERPAAPETRQEPEPGESVRRAPPDPSEPEPSRSAQPAPDRLGADDEVQDGRAQDEAAQDEAAQGEAAQGEAARGELAEEDARPEAPRAQAQRQAPEPSETIRERPEATERSEAPTAEREGDGPAQDGPAQEGPAQEGPTQDGAEPLGAEPLGAERGGAARERAADGATAPPASDETTSDETTSGETASEKTAAEEAEAGRDDAGPSFDVVRVERDGSSVMAGRAAPGSEVVVRKDGEEVARGRADARGEFVLLPERPLPPGDYALELEATDPQGETRRGGDLVVLSVPERRAAGGEAAPQAADQAAQQPGQEPGDAPAGAGALVVQVPADAQGETRVMQLPEPAPAESAGGLWLEAVDYDPDGALVITGQGKPGQRVVAYLDNAALGETTIGADGRWRLAPEREVAPGLYTLRIDQLDAEGTVTARVESPFARAAFETADLAPEERFVVIQPGNNLWTIARRTYGAGPRYTVIFDANADQIRDPDLIYPGQIFVLPREGQAG